LKNYEVIYLPIKKLINFRGGDFIRILQKIKNSDDCSSRISSRILVGNAVVADCGILMEFSKNFD
jgi:hypothetical protein